MCNEVFELTLWIWGYETNGEILRGVEGVWERDFGWLESRL